MNRTVDILSLNSINAINGPVVIHRSILKHVDYFQSKGYDISIILKEGVFNKEYTPDENTNIGKYINPRLQIFLNRIKVIIILFFQNHKYLRVVSYNFFNFKTSQRVKKYLKLNRKPDIVITDSEVEMFYFLKYNKQNSKTIMFMHTDGIPLKMMCISNPGLERSNYYEKLKLRYEYTIKHVDKIAFICNIGKFNFLESYPEFDITRLSVILNGVEENEAFEKEVILSEVNQFRYNLCCVGTLTYRKGQEIILKALSQLEKEQLQTIHVTIIGDGPEKKYFENIISENNLHANVSLLGSIDNLKVDKYLLEANIFILMSRNEGLPISIIEAMRAGLPVISTSISGIPELVENGLNGLLLEPDTTQLVDIFNHIDEYDWEAMGVASRQIFKEKFTLDRMFSEYCDMYNSLFK
jgi:Glycosyltransferase